MNFPYFLAKRITQAGERVYSKMIARVAIGTIATGIVVMILAVAILNGFKSEIIGKQRGFLSDIQVTHYQKINSFESQPISITDTLLKNLKNYNFVEYAYPYITKPVILNSEGQVEGLVMKGVDEKFSQKFLHEHLIAGDTIGRDEEGIALNDILLSEKIANRLQLEVGSDFMIYFVQEPVRKRKLNVVGIYKTGVEELDNTYLIGSANLLRRINGWGDTQFSGINIRVNDFEDLMYQTNVIQNTLSTHWVAVNIKEQFMELFQWLDLLDANPQIILALMMCVALINIISALLIMILERTQMIGLLKSMGMKNTKIRAVFLYLSMHLIGLGLLIGNAIAIIFYFIQKKYQLIKLDEENYYMSFVPVQIGILEVLLINLGVIIISLIVLIIPSLLITKIQPVKTLRFQ